jgi:Zn-dependent M28 family amino/carboxypeptidase
MPLTEEQKCERIAVAALISLWSLPALAFGRSVDSAGNATSFDGARAYEHVRHLVEIGPRPPASDGIHRAQAYIIGQLKSFGCPVEEHDFHASTVLGNLGMKNIVVKLPGTSSGIVLYTTHYDTVRIPNFVGADDSGSGTGAMLELARLFCARKNSLNVWIVFFDGEEAQGNWTDAASVRWNNDSSNNTFGSREMAAQMALSGDLKRVKAMILADMIGPPNVTIKRDTNSTPWLTNFIWDTAAQLGYKNNFVDEDYAVGGDDHFSFIRRGVAGCDLIDFSVPYWHTTQDTLDKIDPKSLAIVGQVLSATLPRFEKKFP